MRRDLGVWVDLACSLGIRTLLDCRFARQSVVGKLMAGGEVCWRIESSSQSLKVGRGRLVLTSEHEM